MILWYDELTFPGNTESKSCKVNFRQLYIVLLPQHAWCKNTFCRNKIMFLALKNQRVFYWCVQLCIQTIHPSTFELFILCRRCFPILHEPVSSLKQLNELHIPAETQQRSFFYWWDFLITSFFFYVKLNTDRFVYDIKSMRRQIKDFQLVHIQTIGITRLQDCQNIFWYLMKSTCLLDPTSFTGSLT